MACESQGAIENRGGEHLGVSDRVVIMFRKLLHEQIIAAQNGENLIGINFDPAKDEVIRLIREGYDAYSFAAARAEKQQHA